MRKNSCECWKRAYRLFDHFFEWYGVQKVRSALYQTGVRIILSCWGRAGIRDEKRFWKYSWIVGMEKPPDSTNRNDDESARIIKMRDELIYNILKMESTYLTGHRTKGFQTMQVSDSVSLKVKALSPAQWLGITASTGSACSTKTLEPSHVLIAMDWGMRRHTLAFATLGAQIRKRMWIMSLHQSRR